MSSQDKTFGKIEKRSLVKNLSKTSPRPPVCNPQRVIESANVKKLRVTKKSVKKKRIIIKTIEMLVCE